MSKRHVSVDFAAQLTAAQGRLYAYILSLLPDRDSAADVLQDANRVLLEKAGDFEPGTNFMAWAFRIAHFEVLAARKRRARSRDCVLDDELIDQLADETARRDDRYDDERAALARCMQRLSPRQKRLIEARYEQDMTVQDAADMLAIKPNTAAQALHRARLDLLECIRQFLASDDSNA